jgi:competence protein ComEC
MFAILLGAAWLVGVAAGLRLARQDALLVAAVALLTAGILWRAGRRRSLAFVIAGSLLGAWWGGAHAPERGQERLLALRGGDVTLVGLADGPVRCGAVSCQFPFAVQGYTVSGRLEPIEGRVSVVTSAGRALQYGQSGQLRGRLLAPRDVAGFPRAELLARQGIFAELSYPRLRPGPAVDLGGRGKLEALREELERRLTSRIPDSAGALVAGLLLGRDVKLDSAVRDRMSATGTSHILAVSGANVVLVGAFVAQLLKPLLGARSRVVLGLAAVAGYTLLVGASPSAVRAALMFGAAGLAALVGRLPDPLTALVLAAAVLAMLEPTVLLDLGFQLSLAATAGLILVRPFRHAPRGLRGLVPSTLAVSLVAQIATLPLTLRAFHSVSVVAPLANLLVAPAVPIGMIGAAATLGLGDAPGLGDLVAGAAGATGRYLLAAVDWAASLPGASHTVGAFPIWAVALTYLLLLLPLAARWLWRSRRLPGVALATGVSIAGASLGFAALVTQAGPPALAPGELRARFLNVGGDALTLLETSEYRILVGSASSRRVVSALAELLPFAHGGIDLLIVDRAGDRAFDGLLELAARVPIRAIVQPSSASGPGRDDWRQLLVRRGIAVHALTDSIDVRAGEQLGLSIELINRQATDNGPLLAVRVGYGETGLLLAGGDPSAIRLDSLWQVVQLGPSLTLTEERRSRLAGQGVALVVGGRGLQRQEAVPAHMVVADGDVVEVLSDGRRLSARREPCQDGAGSCAWSSAEDDGWQELESPPAAGFHEGG